MSSLILVNLYHIRNLNKMILLEKDQR